LIETLRVENIAILERAELEFGPGLNVLTGETGTGKSIVLGALALLAGGRASSESIRDGADAASVEAVFRTEGLPDLDAELIALTDDEADIYDLVRSIRESAEPMNTERLRDTALALTGATVIKSLQGNLTK